MMGTSLKHWPISERPRERLLLNGPESLSDAELLAILIRNGCSGKDALMLSREMLTLGAGLRGIFSMHPLTLQKIKGLGEAKIATLLAVSELMKRLLREKVIGTNMVRDPESVMQYLTASLQDLKREIFKVLFLDRGNRILDEKTLFEGTVDHAAVHPREIIKTALEKHASALILVHNHPSGRSEPSPEDRAITSKIQTACYSVGIRVLDHLIIGDGRHYSFREFGLL